MARFDLTDFEWSVIEPVLPNKPRGVPRVDDRRVLNGIFWRLRTGAPWADIPERYGPHTTCVNRFNRWRRAGVWDRLLDAVSKAYDGGIQMIDSSSIRVHQHAANAQKKTADPVAWSLARRSDDEDPCPRRRQRPAHRPQAHRGSGPRRAQRRRHARFSRRRSDPDRRSRLRLRRPPSGARRAWGAGQHQALAPPNQPPGLLPLALPLPEPRRALLQQAQALPRRRHPLRQGPRQRPGCRKLASARIWMRFN